jgi:hypothetical protein
MDMPSSRAVAITGRWSRVRMILDLIVGQRQLAEARSLFHQCRVEVRHADVTGLAGFGDVVQRGDLLFEADSRVRPVQQEQIDVVRLQLRQAFIDRRQECIAT